VRAAQKQFERDSNAAREARRKAFAQAQKDGLSLRAIGELVASRQGSPLGRETSRACMQMDAQFLSIGAISLVFEKTAFLD